MTLPRYRALYDQFREAPPLRVSLAALVGWKPSAVENATPAIDARQLFDLVPAAPGATSKVITLEMLAALH